MVRRGFAGVKLPALPARPAVAHHGGMQQQASSLATLAQACIHCGLCLEACPTWQLTGREDMSPRGRIRAMVDAGRGEVPVATVLPAVDACLGCRACETACPSGVRYGAILEGARAEVLEPARPWSWRRMFWRPLIRQVLPYRRRFALLMLPVRLIARLPGARAFPLFGRLSAMLPPTRQLPEAPNSPAVPQDARRAVLLEGCALPVLYPGVVSASERLLAAAGYRVARPATGCCGALEAHDGATAAVTRRVSRVFGALDAGVDVVVTEAAGCGAHLKAHRPEDGPPVLDLAEALLQAGWQPRVKLTGPSGAPLRVAYQDPCHLLHGQRLHEPARTLLERAGAEVLPVADPGRCCGGAGTHAFLHPGAADRLGQAKWDDLAVTRPDVVVTANPSCQMQLDAARRGSGGHLEVLHLTELLVRAL
ncbi:MAG: 4Fe-4S dicluster domain-containing protein [Candidatus Sericytochromatia bacterium]|nr:4Fe-4S dicluster domain-containing protein [Candidatus Tanganyikabacteria bacterium]